MIYDQKLQLNIRGIAETNIFISRHLLQEVHDLQKRNQNRFLKAKNNNCSVKIYCNPLLIDSHNQTSQHCQLFAEKQREEIKGEYKYFALIECLLYYDSNKSHSNR